LWFALTAAAGSAPIDMATAKRAGSAPLLAFVLHRYDWSESSLILDLFTREQGRIAVAAKGAKRPFSHLRPVLLPFQRIQVSLGRPRSEESTSEVQTLRGAEWGGGAAMLTGAALFSGFYLNELLMKLLARHDPHPHLFDAYAQTLTALDPRRESALQAALRAFELTLLREVGVLPELSVVTLTQETLQAAQAYSLVAEAGVTAPRADAGELSGAVLLALQAALEHGSMPALRHACETVLPELKGALRGLLHYHLGTDQLRTRRVLMTLPIPQSHPQR
jgi:DNA repair protein RecO (recombination protein O)